MIVTVMAYMCDKCSVISHARVGSLPRGWNASEDGQMHYCKTCSVNLYSMAPANKDECDECAFSDFNDRCCWPASKGARPCER